ncbi:cellulose biosynthesis protein BcsS [Methylobacterium sp. SyP6R]|uniref:cellulose biosynthesis protein BcsS n=1 Tax=Methylobacterium sp. SyP6R TaxID=2718876 RepID=UPI001F3C3F0B|nr:cellulose biosynthesis protein BcsS [Methylobacterium sp. SyP6R]MCF4125605.1 cellulose biosynthesis protein BcsS [Methylobacterium sp. SyP6R]
MPLLRARPALLYAAVSLACPEGALADEREEVRTVLFGSLDAGRSTFVSAGAKVAPGGIGRDGFVTLATLGYGLRPERDWWGDPRGKAGLTPPRTLRHTVQAGAVAGWQWVRDWGVAALFAGPEIAFEVLDSPGTRKLPTPRIGARVQGELWARPTETTLLTTTLIAGTARWSAWGRVSWGIRVPEWSAAYLGPEAALYADRTGYRKWSLGLHATDFAIARLSFRVSAGWVYEEQIRRPGAYGTLTAWLPL